MEENRFPGWVIVARIPSPGKPTGFKNEGRFQTFCLEASFCYRCCSTE